MASSTYDAISHSPRRRRRRRCCSPRDELNVMCSFILPSADSCFLIEYDKCHSFPLSVRWTIHPFTPYITFVSLNDQNSVVRQVQHPSWHCFVGFQRCQWHERTMRDDERRNIEEENVPPFETCVSSTVEKRRERSRVELESSNGREKVGDGCIA